jgi:hypothetical protein
MQRLAILLPLLMLLTVLTAAAQELNCVVTVNTDNLQSDQQGYVANFGSDVEQYLNNNHWTGEDAQRGRIDCSLTIYFLSGTEDGQYAARIVVTSQRPIYVGSEKSDRDTQVLQIADVKWNFHYVGGQPMIKDEYAFDPLTDVLDFYAYLIVGMDAETYTELSGSQYFQRALGFCSQAMTTSFADDWQSGEGVYGRCRLVNELLNAPYQQFRPAFTSYHFDGLDLLGTDQQKGLDNMLLAVESIARVRREKNPVSILVRTFFDAKYIEIANVFQAWPDRGVYDRLIAADPDHESTYEAYREK